MPRRLYAQGSCGGNSATGTHTFSISFPLLHIFYVLSTWHTSCIIVMALIHMYFTHSTANVFGLYTALLYLPFKVCSSCTIPFMCTLCLAECVTVASTEVHGMLHGEMQELCKVMLQMVECYYRLPCRQNCWFNYRIIMTIAFVDMPFPPWMGLKMLLVVSSDCIVRSSSVATCLSAVAPVHALRVANELTGSCRSVAGLLLMSARLSSVMLLALT